MVGDEDMVAEEARGKAIVFETVAQRPQRRLDHVEIGIVLTDEVVELDDARARRVGTADLLEEAGCRQFANVTVGGARL
jgi:hypothetical protein